MGDFNGGFSGKVVKEPVVLLSFEAKYFDDLTARGDAYGRVFNTITSLIYNKDYQQFYHEKGFSLALLLTPGFGFNASVKYKNSQIWDTDSQHIIFPLTTSRKEQFNRIDVSADKDFSFDGFSFQGSALTEISIPSSFTTLKLELVGNKRIGGLGLMEITARYETLLTPELPAPFVGPLPSWDYFFFETRSGFFSHNGYFRGLSPFEFQGDRLWSLNLEHNFYDLPTRLLGIHFLDQFDLHWLLHAGIGEIEHEGVFPLGSPITGGKPYSEIGLGIGNIMNILQLEGTWRLTHKTTSNFYPTLEIKFSF